MPIINKAKIAPTFFVLLLIFGSQTFTACQTKSETVSEALENCRQFLVKDDFVSANKCFGQAVIAHSKDAAHISRVSRDLLYDKCKTLLQEKKDYQQAIICFEGMTVYLPDDSAVFTYLADSYYKYFRDSGDKDVVSLENAERSVKRAVEIRPENAIAYNTYGLILEEKGDLSAALEKHAQAVKLEPNDSLYRVALALVQERMNKPDDALKSYQSALEVNPKDTTTLYFLQRFYERSSKFIEALETLERRLKLEPATEEDERKLIELKAKSRSKK